MKGIKKLVLIACIIGIFIPNYSINVTPVSQFSILTNTPGEEIYTLFGHVAIRFQDSIQDVDIVFNYGTFDFRTPNFYLKFVKGRLDYFISVETFEQYLWGIDPIQSSYEQELNLTEKQKNQLLQFLLNNIKPENKYYKYEFFDDNCATRIRDALQLSLGDEVNFGFFQPQKEQSFRKLLSPYLKVNPWVDLGINILLGIYADKTAEPLDYLYLPDYVMEAVAVATIDHDKENQSLVSSTKTIQEAERKETLTFNYFTPFVVFMCLLILAGILTIIGITKKKVTIVFDRFLFGTTGVLGLVLLVISLYTDHLPMNKNLNILWAFPIHLIVVFFLKNERFKSFLKYYFLFYFFILLLVAFIWVFFPQDFYFGLIPLITVLAMRSVRLIYYYK